MNFPRSLFLNGSRFWFIQTYLFLSPYLHRLWTFCFFFLKLHLLVIILSTGIKIWLCTKTDRNALLTSWIHNYWGSNIGAVFNHALVWISILAQFYYKSQLYKHIISILSTLPLGASTFSILFILRLRFLKIAKTISIVLNHLVSSLLKPFKGPFIWKTWYPFTTGCSVWSLVEIDPFNLKKRRKLWKAYEDNDRHRKIFIRKKLIGALRLWLRLANKVIFLQAVNR